MMDSPFLQLLQDRVNLVSVPFTERGSRLMVFREEDSLFIRMAERWFKVDQKLSGYRQRRPLVTGLRLTDANGNVLPFTPTTYPHCVELATPLGLFRLFFADTESLVLALPAGKVGVTFETTLDSSAPDRRGGVLRLSGDIRRNIAYTTNARILCNEVDQVEERFQRVHLDLAAQEGHSLLLNITPRLGFNRCMPDAGKELAAAARRWHDWFAAAPPVKPEYASHYYFAWWLMRAGLISTRFYTTREAMTPSKVHYVGVWQWDAFFHALAYRHVDMRLAEDQLRIVLDHQRADGMIPDAIHDEGIITHLSFPVEADVTKPPLLAWTAWKLYEQSGDREFLDEIYEPVVRWNRWWFEKNDLDGNGLCEYLHPFSSGLDDSPLWDGGMPVEAPDLNTYLCLQLEALGRMAKVIGEEQDAARWMQEADEIARRMVDSMWDPEAGMFWATHLSEPVRVKTPFSLFPLLTGRLAPEIVRRLVASLQDESTFWTRYPVATVARDDPRYDPLQMWRGPTWINANYLLVEGLERVGEKELARELRRRSLELVMQMGDFSEYYHPETGEKPPKAASIFGWTASLFIEMALRESEEM